MDTQDLIIAIISAGAVILAALIGGVITLVVQAIQLKRDGKAIDSISSDTADMKPKVENIDSAVKDMVKDVGKIEDRSRQISSIATAVESFKYLKENSSENAVKPEMLLANIASILEENADLRKQHQEDQRQLLIRDAEINKLRSVNQQLEAALKRQTPTPSDEEWEP